MGVDCRHPRTGSEYDLAHLKNSKRNYAMFDK